MYVYEKNMAIYFVPEFSQNFTFGHLLQLSITNIRWLSAVPFRIVQVSLKKLMLISCPGSDFVFNFLFLGWQTD